MKVFLFLCLFVQVKFWPVNPKSIISIVSKQFMKSVQFLLFIGLPPNYSEELAISLKSPQISQGPEILVAILFRLSQ